MTIEELLKEHEREVIEIQVDNLKCCDRPLGMLPPLEQRILKVLAEIEQVEWFEGEEWFPSMCSLSEEYTYRIKPDYVLPDTELEVFWGERENEMPPFYYLPSGDTGNWDILAGWANDNGWEFHGFRRSKVGESLQPHTPFYDDNGKIQIKPFAKFIRKK